MYSFIFTKKSEKEFKKLDNIVQERIVKKLQFLKSVPKILPFLKKLEDFNPATHRLRVGSHRLILQYKGTEELIILKVGERKDIYKSNNSCKL